MTAIQVFGRGWATFALIYLVTDLKARQGIGSADHQKMGTSVAMNDVIRGSVGLLNFKERHIV